MASDDEFRRVGEEIRALARSLARDFREVVDQSRAGGDRPGEAVRQGLKGVADEARRGMQESLAELQRYRRPRGCRPYYWGWYPPPPAGDRREEAPAGGASPAAPAGWPPPHRPGRQAHPHRRRGRRGLPPVRHRWDATTVIGGLAVVFGVAWLLDALNAAHISVEGAVAVGLMLLGAAMIVTGRTDWSLSRRAWPVFAGAALILVLVATSTTFGEPGTSALTFGNRSVVVAPAGQKVDGGFGNLSVDASALRPGGKVTISNVAGNVHVLLPAGIAAHIDARVLAGEVCVYGRNVGSGVGASVRRDIPGTSPGVLVDVHETSGQIIVGPGGCGR